MRRALLRQPVVCCAGLLLILVANAPAQHTPVARPGAAARAARAYAEAQKQGPLALHAFLVQMPKGADLHVHLSGAIYAETWLAEAAEDGMCIDPAALSFDRTGKLDNGSCRAGDLPASAVTKDQHLYDELIDAFSMRTFVPVTGESGHDHFFNSFDHFNGVDKRHFSQWVDEVVTRAAAQNEQYLELMDTPPEWRSVAEAAEKLGWQADLARYRDALLPALRQTLPEIRATLDKADAERQAREHCVAPARNPTPAATTTTVQRPSAACQVQVRYIYQVLRGISRESDFAQILLGFELASVDPRFVGVNLVRPEDANYALSNYATDMSILDALHALYPRVHLSLHAGELAPGMVPPSELTYHIRSAVEAGHAERIGHGVDVMYEDHPYDLLKEMAARHVMVEINLTSNDVILGIAGDEHPLPFYLAAHVPVALSTDDEGVSRIDLTHEYVRAAVTYRLTYDQLKQMARTSLEHSFLPGASLWHATTPETLTDPAPVCRTQLGAETPTGACANLVTGSEKAQQQWELERRFHIFEASF